MRPILLVSLLLITSTATATAVDVQRAARVRCRSDTLHVLPQMLATLRGAPDIHILARMHSAFSRWIYRPCTLLEFDEPDLSLDDPLAFKLDLAFMGDMVDPTFGDEGMPDQIACREETAESFLGSTVARMKACEEDVERCRETEMFTALASRFIKWEDDPCKFREG